MAPLPPAIALISPTMGCGKSTVATYLWSQYGYDIIPFARPIKLMVETLLGCYGYRESTIRHLMTAGKEEPLTAIPGHPSVRRLAQLLGTEYGRQQVHPDVWVEAWKVMAKDEPRVVADDCRFPNEYQAVRAIPGALIWRVTRRHATLTHAHASEGALDHMPVDSEIPNNGTVAELHAKVDLLLAAAGARA